MRSTRSRLVGVGVLAGVLGGCASNGASRDEAPATPVVSGELIAIAQLAVDAPEVLRYRALGEDGGTLEVVRVPGDDGSFRVTERVRLGDAEGSERELVLRRTPGGDLELVREVNHAERVIVDFDPPLIVYPAGMMPGEVREQRLRMVVHPMKNPDRVQAQGDAVHTVRYEKEEKIDTGSGVEVEARKLVSVLEADLGGPQVVNESQEWLAPGRGVVARKKMERTTLLGVRIRANNEWWVLDAGN